MLETVPEGMDQQSEHIQGRQGFLIKCSLSHSDYHLLFIPYEIMKNMAHISLLLETQSTEQLRDKLALFMHFVFLNLYFQISVTYKSEQLKSTKKYFMCLPPKKPNPTAD